MNEFLSKATLAAVIAASPDMPGEREEAAEVIEILMKLSADPKSVYSAKVGHIAENLNRETVLREITDPPVTAAHVGKILHAMGLSTKRSSIGYRVFWSQEQLEILYAEFRKEMTAEMVAQLNKGAIKVDQETFEKEVTRLKV